MTQLEPDKRAVQFLDRVGRLVAELPWWKRGVLEASSRSMNSRPRPVIESGSMAPHTICIVLSCEIFRNGGTPIEAEAISTKDGIKLRFKERVTFEEGDEIRIQAVQKDE